jgi:hypothetical protein
MPGRGRLHQLCDGQALNRHLGCQLSPIANSDLASSLWRAPAFSNSQKQPRCAKTVMGLRTMRNLRYVQTRQGASGLPRREKS